MAESERISYHVTTSQTFANFARGKWSNHDSKKCSEIRTVTCLVIWLWKLKISIFVCLFVYLFVCTSRFANFANGKWSNHDSKNCSEIRTVTWSVIWLWKLQFTILIFFTPLQSPSAMQSRHFAKAPSRLSPKCLQTIDALFFGIFEWEAFSQLKRKI